MGLTPRAVPSLLAVCRSDSWGYGRPASRVLVKGAIRGCPKLSAVTVNRYTACPREKG